MIIPYLSSRFFLFLQKTPFTKPFMNFVQTNLSEIIMIFGLKLDVGQEHGQAMRHSVVRKPQVSISIPILQRMLKSTILIPILRVSRMRPMIEKQILFLQHPFFMSLIIPKKGQIIFSPYSILKENFVLLRPHHV